MPSSRNIPVKWTRTALANLVAILTYIEKDSPQRAKSFALEIRAKTNLLSGSQTKKSRHRWWPSPWIEGVRTVTRSCGGGDFRVVEHDLDRVVGCHAAAEQCGGDLVAGQGE